MMQKQLIVFGLALVAVFASLSASTVNKKDDEKDVVMVTNVYDVGESPHPTVELLQPYFKQWLADPDYMKALEYAEQGPDFYDFPAVTKIVNNGAAQYFLNLVPGETYDWNVGGSSGKFTVAADEPRMIAAQVFGTKYRTYIYGFHDLGGWRLEGGDGRTKYGVFYRTAHLDRYYMNSDHRAGNPIFTTLGIKTEIDLRQESESWIEAVPGAGDVDDERYYFTQANEGSTYAGQVGQGHPFITPPSVAPEDVDGQRYFKITYQPNFIEDDYDATTQEVRRAFHVLGQSKYHPVLFHCAGGRDRTGQVAFLIEAICGVHLDDIGRDSQAIMFSVNEPFNRLDQYIARLYELEDAYGLKKYGDSLAGHARAYLERYGVTTEEIAGIIQALTGETPQQVLDRVDAHEAANHYRTIRYQSPTVNWTYRVGDDTLYRVPAETPVLEGKAFAGWSEEKNGVRTALWKSAYADTITISEVMAKNESSAVTANGFAGIDWVELHNAGATNVNLVGWCLGNDPGKTPRKWPRIEGSCVIPAGGYKVVWFDGDGVCTSWGADEAHVACNLSGDAGEHTVFLASAADKESIIQKLALPKSYDDVSCGWDRPPVRLVGEKAAAQYCIGDSGSWKDVQGALGMSEASSGLRAVSYQLSGFAKSAAEARTAIATPSKWKSGCAPITNYVDRIAFRGEETPFGAFATGMYADFPGYRGFHIVLSLTGRIIVPSDGEWTFAVGSDDGFGARISQGGTVKAEWANLTCNEWGEHGYNIDGTATPDMGMKTVSLTAGEYDFDLVYYDVEGHCALDCSAAKGGFTVFDSSKFHLLGSDLCEIRFPRSFRSEIVRDVRSEMLGTSKKLNWKTDFTVGSDEAKGACKLRIRYADGFSAKINGHAFASVVANGPREAEAALKWVDYPIPADYVKVGENTLTIDATNNSTSDPEFFLQAVVVSAEGEPGWVYYPTPTPGAVNSADVRTGATPPVAFSEPHGYKSAEFQLALTCEETDRAIYYTLDGSRPAVGGEKTHLYTAPFTVSRTTVVRAAAADENSIFQTDTSATYLFLDDILQQGASAPDGFPESETVNGQVMRYGLNTSITGDSEMRAKLRRGFLEGIRTVSLVMDPADLFDAEKGIYVNGDQSGRAWERMTMLEQIHPTDTEDEFSVACGVRIRGAYSRHPNYPKRGFHMIFRDEYGASRLEHPLFGADGARSFKKIDFRCDQNNAWVNGKKNGGSETDDFGITETLINEVFSRDSQRDMNQPYNRSNYYHLFLNGIYWGVYQSEERTDQNYAADYLGGDKENYDVVRTSNTYAGGEITYTTGVVEGEEFAWRALYDLTVEGYAAGGNYNRVRGLDADGRRDPALPIYLDVTNLVCYMLTSQWGADGDSPASIRGNANNIIAYRNRVENDGRSEGFKWNRHDAENSMAKRTQTDGVDAKAEYLKLGSFETKGASFGNFNPQALHCELMKNAEYRRTFQDIVQKELLAPGGAMTIAANRARYQARMAEIDDAVMGELARWGGAYTRADWETACANDLSFIDNRPGYLFTNYRELGWFPDTEAPSLLNAADDAPLTDGMQVAGGFQVRMTRSAGTIYYTTDGSDPAKLDGTVGATAIAYGGRFAVSDTGLHLKARVKNGSEWSALSEVRLLGTVAPEPVFTGVYDTQVAISASGSYLLSNAVFNAGLKVADGVVAKLKAVGTDESQINGVYAAGAEVRFTGDGTVSLTGDDTVMTVSNLVVKAGTLNVRPQHITADGASVIRVLGFVEQSGGVIDLGLDCDTSKRFYGISVLNKDPKDADGKAMGIVYATFGGGELRATVRGTDSAVVRVEKGSVLTKFKGGETVSAVLKGDGARVVSSAGDIEFRNCAVTVGEEDAVSGVRAFESDKDILVADSDAHLVVELSGAGDEALASGDTITVTDGTLELVTSGRCLDALNRISLNGRLVYAKSAADDVFDSNGDMELNGGTILAFTDAAGHKAFDVDPEDGEQGENSGVLRLNGGVIFATGGEGVEWPTEMVDSKTAYVRNKRSFGDCRYLELVSEFGPHYVAKITEEKGRTIPIFSYCPAYSGYQLLSSAPTTGDQNFHDFYITNLEETNQDQLRFFEIYGATAEGSGDVGEYIVLTNLSSSQAVDLKGLKVNVEKRSDWEESGESASKCLFTLAEGTVPAGGSVRFDQAVYWSGEKQKIANGELYIRLTDSAGEIVQSGKASFDNKKYPGTDQGGASLIARVFKTEMKDNADYWRSSKSDPVDPVSRQATGGDYVHTNTIGGVTYCIHEFTSTDAAATFENVSGKPLEVEYLVVGGGGAGGDGHSPDEDGASPKYGLGLGGGGGGGGVLGGAGTVAAGGSWAINVGCGGSLTGADGRIGYDVARIPAGASAITNDTVEIAAAPGGGSGGSCTGNSAPKPTDGAAGGGSSSYSKDNGYQPGAGTFASSLDGQTYYSRDAGGKWSGNYAGGGGGAGGVGTDGTASGSGAGGAGLVSSITGTAVTYGAGGAGGAVSGADGADGATGTGCGGGGGSGGTPNAGSGGSGIVVIRYKVEGVTPSSWDIPGSKGGINGYSDGQGNKVVTFKSVSLVNGTLTVGFEAGKVDADGESFGLICKESLTDKSTFVLNVTLSNGATSLLGTLSGTTDYSQLFILGIGPAEK